jgi:hypothetical protein
LKWDKKAESDSLKFLLSALSLKDLLAKSAMQLAMPWMVRAARGDARLEQRRRERARTRRCPRMDLREDMLEAQEMVDLLSLQAAICLLATSTRTSKIR